MSFGIRSVVGTVGALMDELVKLRTCGVTTSVILEIVCLRRSDLLTGVNFFMKPLQLSNENLSEFAQSNTLESDSGDCFSVNVYEFQEGEDLYGPRARGYQKPKHMWMAKDQALTNIKSNSPTPATGTLDFERDCCATQDGLNSISSGHLRCPSPTNLAYNMGSPSTSGSVQGLSAAMSSCTNTSSSLCSHTSPVTGLSMVEVTNLCESPTFSEVKNEKCRLLTCEINSSVKSKSGFKLTNRKQTSGKASHRKIESNINANSSASDISELSLNNKQSYSHRHRQPRSRNNRKSKRNPTSESSLASFYPVPALNLPTDSHLVLSPCLNITEQVNQESPCQTPMYSKSLPSSSAFVSGGLKIRLRRDAALDFTIGKGKRAKSKTTATFRIVESWCDADAPGGDFTRRATAATGSSTSPTFSLVSGGLRVGDIVWAKLAGYPYWPSQVNAIWARTAHQLSQATLLPTSQSLDSNSSSLAVLATPSDPSLAAGYTARVDWLAWDQCSYLSCAKLYPFKESFDKLYNPRTRVKGYAEAVRLAKQIVNGTYIPNESLDSQLSGMSPQNKSHSSLSGQISAPPSTDSQWSSMTTLSSSQELPIPGTNNQTSRELVDKNTIPLPSEFPPDAYISSQLDPSPHLASNLYLSEGVMRTADTFSTTSNNSCLLIGDKSLELPELDNIAMWAPLPQLDVSGLGVFHVPTFSEDEEELDQSIVNQLHLDFGSCLQ
ncbi:hypothetical protein MN116_005564 [Schistosoma mekongi]|uniref:PWWP domain-containing protein n=1 Tax=Schistosoma mekongi TaxID=38744 RepID=A0AAE1ZBC0_SCHME|nr:hypothetical protein MN116_005564 [Schistosoma mekongi]